MRTRIWHQSFLDLAQLPGYAALLDQHGRSVCGPETIVDLHGVETGEWPSGDYPKYSGQGQHLKVLQIIENAIRAQREGYDAFALSVFLDPGLHEARMLVGIPVVSALESALEVASKMGHCIGLITRSSWMNPQVEALVRRYGYADRVGALTALSHPVGLDELEKVSASPQAFISRFVEQASALVRNGVDVIVPAEGLLNTVLIRNGVREIEGIPVIDSYGVLLAAAEALVRIRRAGASPAGKGEAPPQHVFEALRRATADVFTAGDTSVPTGTN